MKFIANYLINSAAISIFGLFLTSCATQVQPEPQAGKLPITVQNRSLDPSNGGTLIDGKALQAGDIILSATNGINSLGIRMATLSPVSHAALYVGDGRIIEAVGIGVSQRTVKQFVDEEAAVVAFRHPSMTAVQASAARAFAEKHLGTKYNTTGIVLQAPFMLERKICELPLLPALVRDACLRGIAAIQLGPVPNDQFFCSQFVLEAYKAAGLALTSADSRLVSPDDLLHMRQGDVPSVKIHQALIYVGHLKVPPVLAKNDVAQP